MSRPSDPHEAYLAGKTLADIDADIVQQQKRSGDGVKLGLVSVCAADVKPEKVEWLWDQRFPLGKCTLVAGEGGLGKSMVLSWIATTVSCGGAWPCGEGRSPLGSVIILSAEDDIADTLVPRLIAAGANRSKIHIVSAVCREDEQGHRSFNLQLDLLKLEKMIKELGDVLLVEIDPITSYLGKVDSHKNAELRSVLEPLGEMASRLRVTIIANTHLSKAACGSANGRVIGSVAFVNQARAAFIITADAEDNGRRLFIPSKTNLGRPREGLAYRIADTTIPGPDGAVIFAPYVKWEASTVTTTADEAVAACGAENRTAKTEAIEFLLDELAEGPKPAAEVSKAATAAGHTPKAIRTAREALRIKPRKATGEIDGGWVWGLPETKVPAFTSKMPTPKIGHLGHLQENQEDAQGAQISEWAPSRASSDDAPVDDIANGYLDLPDFLDRRKARPETSAELREH